MVYKTSERGQCYYRVVDAGKNHQNPDTSKEGREVQAGTDTLTINGLSEGAKDIIIVVKDDVGNVSDPLVIRIPDIKKKNPTGSGNSGSVVQRPGYGGNKSEATLPGKGNNGEGSLANLKTVGGKGTSSGKMNWKKRIKKKNSPPMPEQIKKIPEKTESLIKTKRIPQKRRTTTKQIKRQKKHQRMI